MFDIVFELVWWVGGFNTNKIKFNIDLIQFAGISVFVLVGEIQAVTTGLIVLWKCGFDFRI